MVTQNSHKTPQLYASAHLPTCLAVVACCLQVTAWEYHRNNSQGKECSHYCFPSAPQLWVWTFKKALEAHPLQPLQQPQQPDGTNKKRKKDVRGCATVLDREEKKIGQPKPKHAVVEDMQSTEQQRQPWQQQGRQQTSSSTDAPEQQQQPWQQQPDTASSVRVPTAQLQYMQAALQRLHNQNKYLLSLLRQRRRQFQQRPQQARLPPGRPTAEGVRR
jgi:hypothetical protein